MKHFKRFKKAFGVNEYGMIEFPHKISNVKISRIQNTDKMGGCSYCFPHGIECTNDKWSKDTRNWKTYRRFQFKSLAHIGSDKQTILEYKTFVGSVEYDSESKTYFGKILNIKDLVTYEAKNKQQLKQEFIDASYDYGLIFLMLEATHIEIVPEKD